MSEAALSPGLLPQAPPLVASVPTWRSAWSVHAARKVATYGPSLIAAVVYAVVMVDCDIAANGLAYLALAVWVLAVQPRKGQWRSRGGDAHAQLQDAMLGVARSEASAARPRAVLVDSPTSGWLPLAALALLAAVDAAAQAALPGVTATDWPLHIPRGVVDFLRSAIGIDAAAQGKDLALRLLRPAVIFECLAVYRRLYCLGTLHRQLQHEVVHDAALDRHR